MPKETFFFFWMRSIPNLHCDPTKGLKIFCQIRSFDFTQTIGNYTRDTVLSQNTMKKMGFTSRQILLQIYQKEKEK